MLDDIEIAVSEEEQVLPAALSEDTTAAQVDAQRDQQGIPWDRLHFSRDAFRQQRIELYRNYTNVVDIRSYNGLADFHQKELGTSLTPCRMQEGLLSFYRNFRSIKTTIIHFQLRNLLWATSSHDVYAVHSNCIKHYNTVTRQLRTVLDLTGGPDSVHNLGAVYVSTACVNGRLVAAGGFNGELVVARAESGDVAWSKRVAQSENCITNALEISRGVSGAWILLSANNDNKVRFLEAETGDLVSEISLDWAANCASVNPKHRHLVAVVGDDKDVHLFDSGSGKAVAGFSGHLDWTFAAAWHPAGNLLASGNQDCTMRVWDVRSPRTALAVLPGRMGSVRTCRFSPDGRLLAAGEPADFVHVYSVAAGLRYGQSVDVFGEVSGIAFSPDSGMFYMGVTDQMYNSVLSFQVQGPDAR